MGFFPRNLPRPDGEEPQKEKLKEEPTESKSWPAQIKSDTGRLIRNPLFVSYTIAAVTSSWVMAVKATFGQKYLEMQFGLTPAEATQLKTYMLMALVVGMLGGGLTLKFAKFKANGLAIFNTSTHFAYLLLFLGLAFLPGCTPQTENDIFGINNETLASEGCNCDQVYNPICMHNFTYEGVHYDQITVVNPCVAGCESFDLDTDVKTSVVFGCEMEKTSIKTRDYNNCAGEVTTGVCNRELCTRNLQIYMIVLWYVRIKVNDYLYDIPLVLLHSLAVLVQHQEQFLLSDVLSQS